MSAFFQMVGMVTVKVFVVGSMVMAASIVNAASSVGELKSFKDLPKLVNKIGQPESTLVVFDNDDTLTMMPCDLANQEKGCQYLGGAAWFSWQSDLLGKKNAKYRVADTFPQLLKISELLFAISNSAYTESFVPSALKSITDSGVRVMVETARGNSNIAATQSQFLQLPLTQAKKGKVRKGKAKKGNANLSNFFQTNSLDFSLSAGAGVASPFIPCGLPDYSPISFQQGIIYVAGQDKGVILKCMLEKYNEQIVSAGSSASSNSSTSSNSKSSQTVIKNIVFVDDTLKNVKNVAKAFSKDNAFKVQAYHYTALQQHKKALTTGAKSDLYQSIANRRFEQIKGVLTSQLLSPNLGNPEK